jgi:F-type H+-transporting ATPase subunit gamma
MANLKEVRNRIVSVTSTQQITKAMKMVSAAKLKRATNAIVQLRPYANKLKEILANLSANMDASSSSPFLQEREPEKVLIVAVSSNRGLAGAFNANVIKTANLLISEKYQEQARKGNVSIVAIGKKTQDYYEKRKYNVIGNNNDLYSELTFANVSKIAETVMEGFAKGDFDRVELVYNQFKNAAMQILTTEQLLPLVRTEKLVNANSTDYILEPSQEEIVEKLIPKSIKTQIFKAVLDSNASEHGARMTAMDKATENAGDLLKALKLSYNQARQAAITTELTEIVSGAAALSNG